jgi:hypothetical protein
MDLSLLNQWMEHRIVTEGQSQGTHVWKVMLKPLRILSVIEKPVSFEDYKYEKRKLEQASSRKEGMPCPRWCTNDVEKLYIMPACAPAHEYICKRLDYGIHYQVGPSERLQFENALNIVGDMKNKPNIIRINDKYQDNYLVATNEIGPDEICGEVWDAIGEAINYLLDSNKRDEFRGNISKDFGFTGDVNHIRSASNPDMKGLSGPNLHEGTLKYPWVKVLFRFLSKRLIKLAEKTNFEEDLYGHKQRSNRDKLRHKLFSSRIDEENFLDSMRIALNKENVCTTDHGDLQNDASDPRYAISGVESIHILINNEEHRMALVGYMKRSVAGFMDKIEKHSCLIDDLVEYYQQHAAIEPTNCDPEYLIVPNTDEGTEKQIFNPCLDKFATLYSGLASGALLVLNTYYANLEFLDTLKYACAVAVATNYSNFPEDYWYLCKAVSKDERFLCQFVMSAPAEEKRQLEIKDEIFLMSEMEPIQLLSYLTAALWRIKSSSNDGQEVRQTINPEPHNRTARMQPAVNKLPSKNALERSFELLLTLSWMLRYFRPNGFNLGADKDVRYLYEMITGFLSHGAKSHPNGVYGCGDLTSQHLIGVCVILNIFDSRIACHAEIPKSTLVATFLYDTYHYNVDSHEEDMRELLIAVVFLLKKHDLHFNAIKAEELICRFMKWKKLSQQRKVEYNEKEKDFSRYKDTMCKGQDVFILESLSERTGDKKVHMIQYHCLEKSSCIIKKTFTGFLQWPSQPGYLSPSKPMPLPDGFWNRNNLRKPKKVPLKRSRKHGKSDLCSQEYLQYFPPIIGKKRLPSSQVRPEDIPICDDPSIIKAPLDSFTGKGEAIQIDVTCIPKTVFGMANETDDKAYHFTSAWLDCFSYPMWAAGFRIPSNDEDASNVEPLYPDPHFILFPTKPEGDKSYSTIFEGKRYFRTKGEAKTYFALYFILTYPATCKKLGGKMACLFYDFPSKQSKNDNNNATTELDGNLYLHGTKISNNYRKIAVHGSSDDMLNVDWTATNYIFNNEPTSHQETTRQNILPMQKQSKRSARKKADIKASDDVTYIDYIRCFQKRPNHRGSKKGRKRQPGFDPFLVAVKYKLQGVAYFLVDKNKGTRDSAVYLHWPNRYHPINSSVMNCNGKETINDSYALKHEFLRLVGNNSTNMERKQKSRLMLKAQWADGHVSWISVNAAVSTIPESTFLYAEKAGLLSIPDWSMVLKGIIVSGNNFKTTDTNDVKLDQFVDKPRRGKKRKKKNNNIQKSGNKYVRRKTVSFSLQDIMHNILTRQSYTPEEIIACFYTTADYQVFKQKV